ncbi:MAG: DeoR/GlpR transcriptional regulator [Clostridia bacterium]|nr:DeoR/GlpR transcriptional regulator [Clostridia bacterium]
MLKDERYDKILEFLETETYVSSLELAKRLFVSMPTIRRDLAYLEKSKRLVRSHGGARKIKSEHTVTPLDFRQSVNHLEKKQICNLAKQFLKDDSVVFLDGSTTVMQLAEYILPKQNITVITNGLPTSLTLIKNGIKTYSTGGELQKNSLAYAGSFAEEFIRKFNIDVCFFSSHGVNGDGFIVDTSLGETQLRNTAISKSEKSVFLCDKSKFNANAPYNLIPLNDVDWVVTDFTEADKLPYLSPNKIITT